jgi:uncharacterized membrane protein SpoIIM required for sporulation
MNRKQFEESAEPRWEEFERLLEGIEITRRAGGRISPKKAVASPTDEGEARLPSLFRQICGDCALARHRMYGLALGDRLNNLVIRGFKTLHRDARGVGSRMLHFYGVTFPCAVRRDYRMFWLSMALFWLTAAAMVGSVFLDPLWVQALLGPEMMEKLEGMYGGEETGDFLRAEYGSDFMMFGFYIMNNISIDFRMFAGGILAGVGTLFYLVFNGLFLGAATGYIHYACNPTRFYTFVCGHSSFELMGVVIAAMAGFHLGLAIISPGRMTRREALITRVKKSIVYLYGAATLTFLAAWVEAFWSASNVPNEAKYLFAGFFWILIPVYLFFCGRRRAPDES